MLDRLPPRFREPLRALSNAPGVAFVLQLPGVVFGRRLIGEIVRDDVPGQAAAMAYQLLFALFPFLIFLAAFASMLGGWIGYENLFGAVMGLVATAAPSEIQRILDDWVSGVLRSQSSGLLTIGGVGALWAASGGIGTLTRGLNRAYGVREDRPFWMALLINLGTTLALMVLMLGGAGLFAGGEWLGQRIAAALGLGQAFTAMWDLLRGPGISIGLGLVLVVVYALLPNVDMRRRQAIPGALLAATGWVALTAGFSIYVGNFGSYDRTFGSLGAAAVLMVWIYFVSMILLVGGEVNALLSGQKNRPTMLREVSRNQGRIDSPTGRGLG
ncbi:MAG: ribonuclease [Chloroflexi bacterium]|nr:ribonuclease [Chloroflexota bacterium]